MYVGLLQQLLTVVGWTVRGSSSGSGLRPPLPRVAYRLRLPLPLPLTAYPRTITSIQVLDWRARAR